MQCAIMTLPPGAACLIVGLFTLMAGLKLPWHKRRTNKGVRDDFTWLHKLLSLNMGRGYYSYSNFHRAPEVRSDASKSNGYAGADGSRNVGGTPSLSTALERHANLLIS